MSTVRELITSTLRLLNVVQANEVPNEPDVTTTYKAMLSLIESWSTEGLMIYNMSPHYFNIAAGQRDYTLGPNGDWSAPRPMDILGIYLKLTGNIDIPLQKLEYGEYANIGLKNATSSVPMKFYDNGNAPLRTVSIWPVPTKALPITLWMWEPLDEAATLDDEINFPPGYERALRHALAKEVCAEFGKNLPANISAIADRAKGTIKRLNSGPQLLRGSDEVASNRATRFNILTGDTIPTNM